MDVIRISKGVSDSDKCIQRSQYGLLLSENIYHELRRFLLFKIGKIWKETVQVHDKYSLRIKTSNVLLSKHKFKIIFKLARRSKRMSCTQPFTSANSSKDESSALSSAVICSIFWLIISSREQILIVALFI